MMLRVKNKRRSMIRFVVVEDGSRENVETVTSRRSSTRPPPFSPAPAPRDARQPPRVSPSPAARRAPPRRRTSLSRFPLPDDVDSCVSCVSFPPAVSFPPVATASVTAAASVAVGGSLVGGATRARARERRGRRAFSTPRAATPAAASRSPDVFRVASCVSRASPSPSFSSSSGPLRRRRRESIGSSAASCVFRVVSTDAGVADLAAASARTRRDASASPAPPRVLPRPACARGLPRRTPRRRGRVVRAAAFRVAPRRAFSAAPAGTSRLGASSRGGDVVVGSVVGTNDDDLLGGFARAPRAVAAVAVGKAPPP